MQFCISDNFSDFFIVKRIIIVKRFVFLHANNCQNYKKKLIFIGMFLESDSNYQKKRGWIEVITGSMFSGKTEELIRRLKRAKLAQQKIEIFKSAVDCRYEVENVVSHDASSVKSIPVQNASEILLYVDESNIEVVGIDEVQFFDENIVWVCNQLADKGVRVIVAGLDMDFKGAPFRV